MEAKFESNSFEKRMKSMLKVDFRRMFTMPLFYIMVGIALVVPILILVMTTMMDGMTTTDPNGNVTTITAFDNVWQIIGTVAVSGGENTETAMGMDMTTMCNINLVYFAVAVFVCLFISEDFRSGYAKNLFTVRAKKTDYVISKTAVSLVCGVSMLFAFFLGAMLGGGISQLSFDAGAVGAVEIVMCMLAKLFLVAVFVPIFLTMSVVAKQRAWLSILLSLGVGMLLFMMIPMMTPLNATIMHVVLCLAGGAMFSVGLGAVSNLVLNKTSLV